MRARNITVNENNRSQRKGRMIKLSKKTLNRSPKNLDPVIVDFKAPVPAFLRGRELWAKHSQNNISRTTSKCIS